MRIKTLALLILPLALGVPLARAQDCLSCIPASTVHDTLLHNPCANSTQGDYCVDTITKTTLHTIGWPDGVIQRAYLTAFGRSACAASCMKDWIGAPWKHKACWPEFYTPVKSRQSYYAAAADATTDTILSWCYAMSYVYAIVCKIPVGRLRYISVIHNCANCPEDRDGDGYASIESGGIDCMDDYAFVYPGAPEICYQGYDANCNGCPDLSEPACLASPVALDMGEDGIPLTSREDGVQFDLDADGEKESLSWMVPNTEDGWLAPDRNGNGIVDDGTELFGNHTPQPDPPDGHELNGFLALAVFDLPENGGDGDGVIGPEDRIFHDLLVWRDVNRTGFSEADELRTLESLGPVEINLNYKLSKKTDEYGNRFRYRAKLKLRHSNVGHWIWDIFLLR